MDFVAEKTTLEELNVLSNFMMNAIANDEDVGELFFRSILSILLERKIGDVVVRAQAFKPGITPESRGVCLDVEIRESTEPDEAVPAECRLYNIEAQLYIEKFLAKRSRFYQAKKDSRALRRGEKNWGKLPELYMLMITNFDPFGMDNVIYTFENTCKEFPELEYGDGLKFIYFNASGKKGGSKAIRELLSYLNCSNIEHVTNDDISHIHSYVTTVKESGKARDDFMTIGDLMDKREEIGYAKGEQAGYQSGEQSGRIKERLENLADLLHDLGEPPAEVLERAKALDKDTLKTWTKLAVRAESMEDFLAQIG